MIDPDSPPIPYLNENWKILFHFRYDYTYFEMVALLMSDYQSSTFFYSLPKVVEKFLKYEILFVMCKYTIVPRSLVYITSACAAAFILN